MTISPQQATEALIDIQRAQRRAFVLRGYEVGAPHFLLWGMIWFVGYGLTDLYPAQAGWFWMILSLGGAFGGYLIGRAAAARGLVAKDGWRYMVAVGATLAFMLLTFAIMQPRESAQFGAFPALLVAFLYVLAGIWMGARWIFAGIIVGGLTIAGYGLLHEHFNLWMAVVGGGTLISTGLWFRRA